MKRTTLLYLAAGLLAFGAPALRADENTNQPPATAQPHKPRRENAFLRAIGLNAADLKGLSKEDRRAKIQSAAQSTLTTLQQKQANGTITEQEKSDLVLIQKRLQHEKNSANTQ